MIDSASELQEKPNRFKAINTVAQRVTKRVALATAASLTLLTSPGTPINNISVNPEPIPAPASQGHEIQKQEKLQDGVCALEDKGNGVFELRSGTKSPEEQSYDQEFLDVLKSLGYTNDDPRVVFISSNNGIGKGYAITPDLVLTVNHVAGVKGGVFAKQSSSVNIGYYGEKLAIGGKPDGDISTIRQTLKEGLWEKRKPDVYVVGTNERHSMDEGLNYLSGEENNEPLKPSIAGTPIATVKGADIALVKLDSPLPNIKGTVTFKDSVREGTEVTIRRTPSKKLFVHGKTVVLAFGDEQEFRFATAFFQTKDKAESEEFAENLPGTGTSGSAVIDEDGNIIGALSRAFTNNGSSKFDEGTFYTVHAEVSSGAKPSEIIGMVKDYCASTQVKS